MVECKFQVKKDKDLKFLAKDRVLEKGSTFSFFFIIIIIRRLYHFFGVPKSLVYVSNSNLIEYFLQNLWALEHVQLKGPNWTSQQYEDKNFQSSIIPWSDKTTPITFGTTFTLPVSYTN